MLRDNVDVLERGIRTPEIGCRGCQPVLQRTEREGDRGDVARGPHMACVWLHPRDRNRRAVTAEELSNRGKLDPIPLSRATSVKRNESDLIRASACLVERRSHRSARRLYGDPQVLRVGPVCEAAEPPTPADHARSSRARAPQRLQDECGGTVACNEAVPPFVEGSEGRRSVSALRQQPQRVQIEQGNEPAPDADANNNRDVGPVLKQAAG